MHYRVIVTRDTTESTYLDVEANSAIEADEKALATVNAALDGNIHTIELDWEADETPGDPYIASPGDAEPLGEFASIHDAALPDRFQGLLIEPDGTTPDECGKQCLIHDAGCDGFCDHQANHINACLLI